MNIILNTAGRAVAPLFGKRIGRVPGVVPLYKWLWRHFGPKGLASTAANGFSLTIDCSDWAVAPSLIFSHKWEPKETEVVRQIIKPGMTAIDIGAHIGYYTTLLSQLVGDAGKVYSFEPSPETMLLLNKNIAANHIKNVTCFPYAVSDHDYVTRMYMDSTSPASNSLWGDDQPNGCTIEVRALDGIIVGEPVDFIKMDIEGGEALALRGMTRIIKENPSLVILLEVHPGALRLAGTTMEEYISLLQSDFDMYLVNGESVALDRIVEAVTAAGSINLLCRRKN